MLRGVSDGWCRMSRMLSGVRSTRARLVIISLTYNPAPYSRHRRRNAVFVMPAIGASTTGTVNSIGPICRGFATVEVDTPRFFQTPVRGAGAGCWVGCWCGVPGSARPSLTHGIPAPRG